MQQLNKIYLVKNLSPWIIDEINAIAEVTSFSLILLRKPAKRYYNEIDKLENKISIYINSWNKKISYRKFFFSLFLLFSHLTHFYGLKNFVFGIKALYWFNRLDLKLFPEPTSIHAQFATQPAIIAYFIKKYLNYNIEYYVTVHAHDIFYSNRWLKIISDDAESLITISDYNINYLKKNYKINPDKLALSRLGVFLPLFKKTKTKNGIDIFKVGFLSWFEEKKGILFLLNAIRILKNKGYSNIQYYLAGDGKLKKSIENYITNNHLSEIITMSGPVFDKQKEGFFNSIDLFVLPSIKLKNDMDGIPVVLMEAIANGIPIISTKTSGIPEICIHEFNGLSIEEKEPMQIANAIEYYLSDLAKLEQHSKNAYEVSQNYDIVKNTLKKIEIMQWHIPN